jgi:hypothetical protein
VEAYYSRAEALDVLGYPPSIADEYRKFKERLESRKPKLKRGRPELAKTLRTIDAIARLIVYSPELAPRERAAQLKLSVTDYWTFWKKNKGKILTAQAKLRHPSIR